MNPRATGVVDVPFDEYLRHPSLSASGAKKILQAPALYRHDVDNPPQSTATFDFGKAVHRLVLGAGDDIEEVSFASWQSKAAQEEGAQARDRGRIPLLSKDLRDANAVAAAVLRHPTAMALLSDGLPEQSLFWTDPDTGVACRARFDWLPNIRPGRPLVIADLKTTPSADPGEFRRYCAKYRYHLQAAWYVQAAQVIGLDPNPEFRLIAVEKKAPYLVSVVQLHPEAMALGAREADRARRIYAECMASGVWPGYGEDVHEIDLPVWAYDTEPFEDMVVA